MFESEKEYKKLFKFIKKWSKHWTTSTAHRAHSRTQYMTDSAIKTLEYINSIDTKSIRYQEKVILLKEFLKLKSEQEIENSKQLKRFLNEFYIDELNFLEKNEKEIKSNIIITIPKMPRA